MTEDDCNRLFSGYAPEAGAARFLEEYGEPVPENFFRDQIANSADLFRARLEQLNAKTVLAEAVKKIPSSVKIWLQACACPCCGCPVPCVLWASG